MQVFTGTSGYSYKEWKGPFYPDDLPASRMLGYYATRLRTVEINNTFYRMPNDKLIAGWLEQIPEGFSVVLKASRRITHTKQFFMQGALLEHLLETASPLGASLGPMLFQFPPYLKQDLDRMRAFLALLPAASAVWPGGWQAGFEFRHASWFDDKTYALLREHGVALVASDTDKDESTEIVPTADYGYLRLRRTGYDARQLADWARRVSEQPWKRAHVFFKHEEHGAAPRMALEFAERMAAG